MGEVGITAVVDLSEVSPEVKVQDITITLVERDVGMTPEVPQLEEADAAASFRFEGNEVITNASSGDPALPGCVEAPSAELAQTASLTDKGKVKLLAEQCDERPGSIRDESKCDFNPEEYEMIDNGTPQIEV